MTTTGRRPHQEQSPRFLKCRDGAREKKMKKLCFAATTNRLNIVPRTPQKLQNTFFVCFCCWFSACLVFFSNLPSVFGSLPSVSEAGPPLASLAPYSSEAGVSCGKSGALSMDRRSAPLCTQGDVMAHFSGRREIGVKFPMRAASVDPKSTQLTPLTIL